MTDGLVAFHETAPVVNDNLFLLPTFNPGFHTHSDEPGCCEGSMQVEFRVKVRRCQSVARARRLKATNAVAGKYGFSQH
jgi:hypothetical protein